MMMIMIIIIMIIVYIHICIHTYNVDVSEGTKGGLTKGGSALLYVFPRINVSSLVSTCFVRAEAFFVHRPLFATAQMMLHMFIFHCCAST